jgi:hypothetical protein
LIFHRAQKGGVTPILGSYARKGQQVSAYFWLALYQ